MRNVRIKPGVKKKQVRKVLEKDRTILADDRTLLSFIRTSLSIFIFAIFILKFFPDFPNIFYIFLATVVIGIVVLLVGFFEYFAFLRDVK